MDVPRQSGLISTYWFSERSNITESNAKFDKISLIPKTQQGKQLKPKLEEQVKQLEFLIEYFAGIKKGDFYEEPIEGEYPDW